MTEGYKSFFPLLRHSPIHYFDYAATCPMPDIVIEEWFKYQTDIGVFVGKGGGILSRLAEKKFSDSETTLRNFFSAAPSDSFIYGKNVTELINIMALSLDSVIQPMDVILVSSYEHHSNYLPWKYLAKRKNALFFELPIDKDGNPDYEYISLIPGKIKIFAFSAVSNSNGIVCDIEKVLCYLPTECIIFEDDSQIVAHRKLYRNERVQCRFLPSHKMYGPKNIAGALIQKNLLERLEPVLLGGGMIDYSGFQDTWKPGAAAFLAGTYDIGLIAAWSAACRFLDDISFSCIECHEKKIEGVLRAFLDNNSGFFNLASEKSQSLFSVVHRKFHAHDIAHILAEDNIIVRSGHLCATGTMRKAEIHAITRISIGLGVDNFDFEALLNILEKINEC